MSAHTPGPWSVEDDTPFSLWVSCPDGKNPLHQNRLNRDRLANARLMAAAPELLEALESIVASSALTDTQLWADARDAVAKAKGGAL
jgi:hypothetical protein